MLLSACKAKWVVPVCGATVSNLREQQRGTGMARCVVCGQPGLYLDLRQGGMTCVKHAAAEAQVAIVRSLTAALLKAMTAENVIDHARHQETAEIVDRLRPFLKD